MNAMEADGENRFLRLVQYWEQDRSNKRLLLDLAQSGIDARRFDEVIEILQVSLESEPGNLDCMFLLGTALLGSGRFANAVSQFEALYQAGEVHPATRYNLAYSHAQLHQYELTLEVLEPFSDADFKEIPDAYGLMGRAFHHLNRLDDAVRWYRRYASARPELAAAWGGLALAAFDNSDATTTRVAAGQALNLDVGNIAGRLALGGLALEHQDASTAIEHFSAAAAIDDSQGRAWSGLGFARMLKLDLSPAREDFEKAVAQMPGHIGTWHGLAWTQILQGDLDAAEQSLGRAMAIDHNFGETHGSLAVVAALKGNMADAELFARRGGGLSPQSFSARYARSLIDAQRGNAEQPQKEMDAIIESGVPGGRAGLERFVAELLGSVGATGAQEKLGKH